MYHLGMRRDKLAEAPLTPGNPDLPWPRYMDLRPRQPKEQIVPAKKEKHGKTMSELEAVTPLAFGTWMSTVGELSKTSCRSRGCDLLLI